MCRKKSRTIQEKMALSFKRIWFIISILIVLLICSEIDKTSNIKYFKEKEHTENEKFNFSILICYPLNPDDNYCDFKKTNESPESCNFKSNQISCHKKSLKNVKNVKNNEKEVLKYFQDCRLDQLVKLEKKEEDKKMKSNYEIKDDDICTRFAYEIEFNEKIFKSTITFEHYQFFKVFVNLKPHQEKNDELNRKDSYKNVYARFCANSIYENCFNHTEKREIEFSIRKLNLRTEDEDYLRHCCGKNCKEKQKKEITELNETYQFNCSKCSIYCHDTFQYEFEMDQFKIDEMNNHSDLILTFKTNYKELVLKTKADDYNAFMLKIFYVCFLLNMNLFNLTKLSFKFLAKQFAFLRAIKLIKILKLVIGFILTIFLMTKLILFLTINESSELTLIEPLFEDDNVSITICFKLENITKEEKKLKGIKKEEIENLKLQEIEEITWNETDFVKSVKVKTSVKILVINENNIKIIYKDKLKCFNYNYDLPTLVQFSSLMRR